MLPTLWRNKRQNGYRNLKSILSLRVIFVIYSQKHLFKLKNYQFKSIKNTIEKRK